jgi:hypothetical protein
LPDTGKFGFHFCTRIVAALVGADIFRAITDQFGEGKP